MNHYTSWDDFCNRVFDECGKSGKYLRLLYGAGGMTLLFVILSMMGMSPFLFITALLGFLVTPLGIVVAAVVGAGAVVALKRIFSERKTLEPVLRRLAESKGSYEGIIAAHSGADSPVRIKAIDALFDWVVRGGARPMA